MGDFNLSVILDAIRRSPDGLSRVELASIVGLAAQTVSNICRRLLDQQLIFEAGKYGSGPGKPRTILKLSPSGMYSLGVHLDPVETNYALLDLTGAVVARRSFAASGSTEPQQVIDRIAAEIDSLITENGIDRTKIAGVGVAAPGPIDGAAGTVIEPPHMPSWGHVPLRDKLQTAVGLPVLLDKDVTAAAVAEIWSGGESGTGSFVFVYMGTGIGSGLVLDDEVVRGSSGNVGEVGYLIADVDANQVVDGLRGRVKGVLMPENIVAEAIADGVSSVAAVPQGTLHEQMKALADAVESGDEAAVAVMERAAGRFATIVSAQASLLDLDHAVFGGPFWKYFEPTFLKVLPSKIAELSVTSKVHGFGVVGTHVGEDVGAVGAACLVLEDTFGPNAASLILEASE
ncbi:ROK family transcriptional regulator [Psychromicrobium xiongbiense]|uniref:ROK family transcriptional regulator n=1 Tax=Psychromicrobium xiongbiense TaxID=3051184 RepID=UPI002555DA2E|nr:ROK family transcriptional regulator [Psychromicrobium sp. YIM S02556]